MSELVRLADDPGGDPPGGGERGGLGNLEYCNNNPRQSMICEGCQVWIGEVFSPELTPPLPAHLGCYCYYWPTDKPVTVTLDDWDRMSESVRWHWVLLAAWLLRMGRELPRMLQRFRDMAEEYNRRREEREQESMPQSQQQEGGRPSSRTEGALTGRVLLAPGAVPERREYDCIFVQPGRVRRVDGEDSDWIIPPDALRAAAGLFNGVDSYVDHAGQFGFGWRQDPSVRDLAGVTFGARWSEDDQAVVGGIRLYDTPAGDLMAGLLDQVIEDREAGREVPSLGLSAVFWQSSYEDEENGLFVTSEIAKVDSVDFVYAAGARGYVRAALALIRGATAPLQEATMPEQVKVTPGQGNEALQEPVSVAAAVAAFDQRLAALEDCIAGLASVVSRETPPLPTEAVGYPPRGNGGEEEVARLSAEVERLSAMVAGQVESETVQGMGEPPRTRIAVGPGSLEQVELAVDALMAGVNPPDGIRPLTGIRELYTLLSGDYEMKQMFRPDRVYLANVTASTMAGLCANALNKVVVNEFMQYPQWWGRAVNVVDFPTLQDARWITLGGVGELPTVAEGAAYTELTWDDQTETDSFVKKGGYLGITIEAIDKDDTNRLRAAPRALAQASWLTLGTSISEIFTSTSGTGPTMADTGVLFNATAVSSTGGHANLLTTALSLSQWRTIKIAMMKQAEVNSDTRLGALTRPRLLWVPVDLEDTAVQILATEHDPGSANWNANVDATGNERETRLANARQRVIVCPLWTDTNNWAAQADPLYYPSIGLGFRYGRTPEIFSVASPIAGLMFSNDVMPIKVRFFYAVGPTDWRGLHKSNVS